MGVSWTNEQKQVIELRNRNLLVSAAAGSGKTAVLVERIIQMITDPKNPVDIDRLLVVTFTRAAAAEMRERISKAIEKKREEAPEDINLARQASLIHNAKISTIDSFCAYVVRNHFGEIDLDPNYRLADEGEQKLMEQDIMNEVFERRFAKAQEEGDEDFLYLIDAYSTKRSNDPVKEMVLRIFRESESCPWPRKWIESLNETYQCTSVEELLQSVIMQSAAGTIRRKLDSLRQRFADMYEMAEHAEGLDKYLPVLQTDLAAFDGLSEDGDYSQMIDFINSFSMSKLPVIRAKAGVDTGKKEWIAAEKKALAAELKSLKKHYAGAGPQEAFLQMQRMAPVIRSLTGLTLEFADSYMKRKLEKKILTFSDIEHYALKILVDEETRKSTKTAEEFRHYFEEIMIDEYQDSNQVQEEILKSISRMDDGVNNMFMVGDVKQSIYRFRQARPELFMEKYGTYTKEESDAQKIELHKNFRSRPQVLDFCNDMFYKIMAKDLGNVAYDEDAALYQGAAFPEADGLEAELLLLEKSSVEEMNNISGDDADPGDDDKKAVEAKMVAARIQRLMKETMVTDKETGQLRPLRYRDIVILFRSLKDWGTTFAQVLQDQGIPAHVDSTTGYFSALEVQTILNFLRILDNPYQDIPMAAVLKSPLCGMNEEALAELRVLHKDMSFAEAAVTEMKFWKPEEGPHEWEIQGETDPDHEIPRPLYEENSELAIFAKKYYHFRKLGRELPIHELIDTILRETGYGAYAACLPAGAHRMANLNMLVEKAIAYEKTSYKGLFHFIRYIDLLEKYQVDYGEADVTGENADLVRIMTIHKSKGLEFPVVFVSGINKSFNLMDARASMVLSNDLGIGLYEQTPTPKKKRESIFHAQIGEELIRESMGEELRVLYVALTRAREKLILSGLVDDREKLYKKHSGNVIPQKALTYDQRRNAASYADWLIPAVMSYPEKYELDFVEGKDLRMEKMLGEVEQILKEKELFDRIQMVKKEEISDISGKMTYHYPYASDISRKSKYSVSELKHASMEQKYVQEEEMTEIPSFLQKEREAYIPFWEQEKAEKLPDESENDLQKARELTRKDPHASAGALRGTAVHQFLSYMNYAGLLDMPKADTTTKMAWAKEFVRKEMDRLLTCGKMTKDNARLIIGSLLARFLCSPVAHRMAEADEKGNLFREKPFVMKRDDGVLIQGIIDAFWMEKDEAGNDCIILLDYKTDRVKEARELADRYQVQLELYADSLERIFSREDRPVKVTESHLYSIGLGEDVIL